MRVALKPVLCITIEEICGLRQQAETPCVYCEGRKGDISSKAGENVK